MYDLCVRAQDMLGNVSRSVFTLEVLSEDDFKLDHVFNYPNPVRMNGRTKFYFYHSNVKEEWYGGVEATIKIFTLICIVLPQKCSAPGYPAEKKW